ncbi:MAG: hypothetical protein RIR70_1421, partial [Pseudomonadota bacterium]
SVEQPQAGAEAASKMLSRQYQRLLAQEDLGAYMKTLRSEVKVEINQAALVPKER